jgi:hypothetical protein
VVGSGSLINLLPGTESVIQYYGSRNPDPKKILADPQH